nr:LuxR family transcriptional regulator [Mycobacterium colombiense]
MGLVGRRAERSLLDGVLQAVRGGESRVLVVHGEAGVGKTALMDYVATHASGCRVARAGGVESEMELAYAAVHQLCTPMLDGLDNLPTPQRDALGTAFGLRAGPAPERFVIGLAVLTLLADAAEEQPLVCLIDDLQWVDRASAEILAFVARRLAAEPVALIVATRAPDPDLSTFPKIEVKGLVEPDARVLLDAVLTVRLDEQVRDQLVAETLGNPLALLELPRSLDVQELAGGFGLPAAARRLSAAMEESFRSSVAALPKPTQRLLLTASAEPNGDPALVWSAAALLEVGTDAAAPAVEDGLIDFGTRVRFRHPLVRSVTYRSASVEERQRVHRALAEVTDPQADPDCRAWHRAQGAPGPDEDVAEELERSADRASARGGLAAAAAFLERATMLTREPAQRAARALAAASAKIDAGSTDAAMELLIIAESGPLTDFQRARVDLIRARLAFVTNRGSDAPPLLLKAAERFEPIDPTLSRATYLEALSAAMFAGRLAVGGGVVDVARAAQESPPPSTPRLPDLLVDGLTALYTDGYAAGLPLLRRAVSAAHPATSSDEQLRWLWLAGVAALHIWDDESWAALSARHVELARAAGALTELPLALSSRAVMLVFAGELDAAESLVQEAQTVTEATGERLSPYGALALAALRADEAALRELTATTTRDAMSRGEGIGITVLEWATAVLNNGIGNYEKALAAAGRAAEHPTDLGASPWCLIELIEAAVRSAMMDTATDNLSRLVEMTGASGTEWALGVQARSRALLSDGIEAERSYREAIERLGRTRMRIELGRAHLLYGEWLRRERRLTDARAQLRTAHNMLDAMGAEAFAERARRELHATGETARKRIKNGPELTAQEAQVARLARDGLTNPEIGARLFISARTVQHHLRKVFVKLGISSRSQLDRVLPTDRPPQRSGGAAATRSLRSDRFR